MRKEEIIYLLDTIAQLSKFAILYIHSDTILKWWKKKKDRTLKRNALNPQEEQFATKPKAQKRTWQRVCQTPWERPIISPIKSDWGNHFWNSPPNTKGRWWWGRRVNGGEHGNVVYFNYRIFLLKSRLKYKGKNLTKIALSQWKSSEFKNKKTKKSSSPWRCPWPSTILIKRFTLAIVVVVLVVLRTKSESSWRGNVIV